MSFVYVSDWYDDVVIILLRCLRSVGLSRYCEGDLLCFMIVYLNGWSGDGMLLQGKI